jgi:hypothetical protein
MAESIQITVTKWDLATPQDMWDAFYGTPDVPDSPKGLQELTGCGGGVTADPSQEPVSYRLHVTLDGKAPVEASVGDVVVFSVAGVDSMSSSEFTSRYGGS